VRNNEISGFVNGIYFKHSNSLDNTGPIIENNYIHGCKVPMLLACNQGYIKNNLIAGNILSGWDGGIGDGGCGSDYNTYEHNTVTGYLEFESHCGASDRGATNNNLWGNIIAMRSIFNGGGSVPLNMNSDYNLFPPGIVIVDYRTQYDLAGWSSANGSDSHSKSGTPAFAGGEPEVDGFLLLPGSPGKGVASDGTDMGADVSLVGVR